MTMHRQPGRTRSACQRTPWRANAEGICRAHSRDDVKGNRRGEKPKKPGSAGSVDGVRDPWSIGMAEAGASQKLLNARRLLIRQTATANRIRDLLNPRVETLLPSRKCRF